VFAKLMALLRKVPPKDPQLEATRLRINRAAARLSTKTGESYDDIISAYRNGDAALRNSTTTHQEP
jgi:hypothetical protein